jgi:hypothetical protein
MTRHRWAALAWLAAVIVFVDAMAGPVPDSNVPLGDEKLWQWKDRYVRIEPQDTPDAPSNDHPARLIPQELLPMLSALQVTRPSKRRFNRKINEDRQLPVFTDQELETLAQALSKGLARAGPREDVTFFITGDHDAGVRGMFRNHDVNSARVFFRGGELNIIFGEIHGTYSGRAVEDTGSREGPAARPWALVPASGIRYHRQGDSARKDWVVIDPRTVLDQYRERGWHISGKAGEPVRGEPAPPDASPATDTPKASTGAPLEAQLGALKDLRERGLITEEIYKERVHRLLDEQLPQRPTH